MNAKGLGAQPVHPTLDSVGLTKRELFAGMVMQGFGASDEGIKSYEDMAQTAIKWADALLAELAKDQP